MSKAQGACQGRCFERRSAQKLWARGARARAPEPSKRGHARSMPGAAVPAAAEGRWELGLPRDAEPQRLEVRASAAEGMLGCAPKAGVVFF